MKIGSLPFFIFGALAWASPAREDKRYLVTSLVIETATVTITSTRGWGPWGGGRKSSTTTSNTVSVIESSLSTSQATSTTSTTSIKPPASATSTTTTTGTNSQTNSPPSATSVSPYADPILLQHNLHRRNHSVPDIAWDDNLAKIAQEIAQSCNYAHNTQAGGGGYGQNIGAGALPEDVPKMITDGMYNDEIIFYPGYGSEPSMSNFEKWGHFSQIVWNETTKLGCFTQYCTQGLSNVGQNVSPYFTVCNYQPTGNMAGAYAKNVLQPLNQPSIVL